MYRFIRASQTDDVNCLVQGNFSELQADDGSNLEELFEKGFTIVAVTALTTGFVLIALQGPR